MSTTSSAHGRRHIPPMLAGAGVGAAGIALLLAVGSVVDRWPLAWDQALIEGLRNWGGPRWLNGVAVNLTALGSGTVLTIVVLLAAGLLLAQRLWLTAVATALACATGGWAVAMVKEAIGRSRPELVAHLVPVSSASFPSGHAANSAIVYLTMAALGSQVTADRIVRRYVMACAILLVGAIGISRVYLGVHWPSDVMAGWSFGTVWAVGWWWATARARASIGGER